MVWKGTDNSRVGPTNSTVTGYKTALYLRTSSLFTLRNISW